MPTPDTNTPNDTAHTLPLFVAKTTKPIAQTFLVEATSQSEAAYLARKFGLALSHIEPAKPSTPGSPQQTDDPAILSRSGWTTLKSRNAAIPPSWPLSPTSEPPSDAQALRCHCGYALDGLTLNNARVTCPECGDQLLLIRWTPNLARKLINKNPPGSTSATIGTVCLIAGLFPTFLTVLLLPAALLFGLDALIRGDRHLAWVPTAGSIIAIIVVLIIVFSWAY